MDTNTIPQQLIGNWIWMTENRNGGEGHQFFRRDFVIDQLPSSAELWVAASSFFQLYFNGRLTGLHSQPCPYPGCVYVMHIPANFLLQQGINQIALQVFDAGKALPGQPDCRPGVWLQLNIDDEPFLATDSDWMGVVPRCFVASSIEQAVGDIDLEMVDFRSYPAKWENVPFTPYRRNSVVALPPTAPTSDEGMAMHWRYPRICMPIGEVREMLRPYDLLPVLLERQEWEKPLAAGRCGATNQSLWVNFREHDREQRGGVFTAECFVYSRSDAWYATECYCNRPYRLFLNETIISEQAVPQPPVHCISKPRGEEPLDLSEYAPTDVSMHFEAGWNRFFLVLDAAACGHGLTIVFTDCANNVLGIHSRPNERSSAGWMLSGPLRTPFRQIMPNISYAECRRSEFVLADQPAWDMALLQRTYAYRPDKTMMHEVARIAEEVSAKGAGDYIMKDQLFPLNEGEYIVFDFGRTLYGYPSLALKGSAGSVVDVVFGEHFVDDRVLAFTGNRRSLSVLTLSGGFDRWMSDRAYGFRYMMVQVRRGEGTVQVGNIHGRVSWGRANRDAGYFETSDELLNRIWKTGVDTLSATRQGAFLDAPAGEQVQYVADAMIQSWSGYHIFGDYALSAQALEAFACTQLETGEINSASPSGLLQILPDYSMLWVIWLHRHFQYTGDSALLERLRPVFERLLNHFNSMAEAPDGPLGDLSPFVGTRPFLDQDDAIERGGICTGLNALYCRALHCAADLEAAANAPEMEQIFRQRAASVAQYMRELTWDDETGLFADSSDGEKHCERHSWQSNVLALYGALATVEDYEGIWSKLFCDEEPYTLFTPGDSENPYFKFFILELAFGTGHREWGFKMMRRYWGAMLDAGAVTWWELFSPTIVPDNRIYSKCHGYGVSPNAFLVSELAGIRPDGIGMARILFEPCFLPEMSWLKVNVPTPLGLIAVEWHRGEDGAIDIGISASYALEIVPVIDEAFADKVTFSVSGNVEIIQPEELPEAAAASPEKDDEADAASLEAESSEA